MKALKVLLTIFLAIVMFFSVTAFSVLTALRVVTSKNFLAANIKDVTDTDKFDITTIIDDGDVSIDEFNEAMDELEEYISREEMSNIIGDFSSQIIRYYVGINDSIDVSNVKKTLKEVAKKYEKKTGEDFDLDAAYADIDQAVKDVKASVKDMNKNDKETLDILRAIFSNKLYYGTIAAIIICALLIIVVNKSIKPLVIALIPISITNAAGTGIFALGSKAANTTVTGIEAIIVKNLSGVFLKFFLVDIAIIILMIVLLILLEKKEKQTN